ncbi:MAG: hypothetical protein CMK92_02230 [Pseudomonas sp.]|nr:hypothetical protein [Pseudomonas sp.]
MTGSDNDGLQIANLVMSILVLIILVSYLVWRWNSNYDGDIARIQQRQRDEYDDDIARSR